MKIVRMFIVVLHSATQFFLLSICQFKGLAFVFNTVPKASDQIKPLGNRQLVKIKFLESINHQIVSSFLPLQRSQTQFFQLLFRRHTLIVPAAFGVVNGKHFVELHCHAGGGARLVTFVE